MKNRLEGMDFEKHNAEVKKLWEDYKKGEHRRIPIILGTATRFFMMHPKANAHGWTFRQYMEDPRAMFDARLHFERWSKFNLLQDAELGLPEKWQVWVDFQNFNEAAWFGCPMEYLDDQVPDTRPCFTDCPEKVMEKGIPGPFEGLMEKARSYYDLFLEWTKKESFMGKPIEVLPGSGCGTDGVMTVACNLFGPDFVCTAMAAEPERLNRLFEFITEATILRIKAWRNLMKLPDLSEGFGFADDSIAMISIQMYREHVLPHHRRLCDALATQGPRGIHLCGDSTRHFQMIHDALNVQTFDTGFPVKFDRLRKGLGPQVRIQGGPHVEFLRTATPPEIREETRRILQSGILEGGLFILREGNNLAPHTPVENTEAMYHAGREFGRLN